MPVQRRPCQQTTAQVRVKGSGMQVYGALANQAILGMGVRLWFTRLCAAKHLTYLRCAHAQAVLRSGRGCGCCSACRGTKEGKRRLLSAKAVKCRQQGTVLSTFT